MKKQLCACLLAVTIVLFSVFSSAEVLTADQLLSAACILVDAKTGEVLFEKQADVRLAPASITKIMTLIIAIENSRPDITVTVPECALDIAPDSSKVPVYPGEIMPMRDLWYGLIFKSGNDAANAIAELVSGSVDAFVDEMNRKAKEIGMTNTQFKNPHGYTQLGHYTTARDMALLTSYALENDMFREITFSKDYTMQPTHLRDALEISHAYAITNFNSSYYYQYARGIKTGYTAAAGQCYVGCAIKGDTELIVVLLQCGWNKPEKWTEAVKLYRYGFEKRKTQP